ncbi:hypothetical protein AVEN_184070-1 [Araneus ventricosus]|uniref:Uncharacterized protein n=1 Tax=Araneus ventricosus TaxID=182803 RepID=A0A4Y2CY40_ARAVE|nr:hypothetical protein AVEN_184070-1 [Araneus ventricosus]
MGALALLHVKSYAVAKRPPAGVVPTSNDPPRVHRDGRGAGVLAANDNSRARGLLVGFLEHSLIAPLRNHQPTATPTCIGIRDKSE